MVFKYGVEMLIMVITKVNIDGFRGLKVNAELNKVNIVVGENGTGKTSFLEAIFLSTLFQSYENDSDFITSFTYAMNSRGDVLSAFSTLSDSVITIDHTTVSFRKKDLYNLEAYVNEDKVAEVNVKNALLSMEGLSGPLLLPLVVIQKKVNNGYYPIYISTFFDNAGNPEKIFSVAKRKNREIKSEFEILLDEYGQPRLHYNLLPAYVMGRGILKKEMIKFSLTASNLLLIDEIEDSLHPDLVMQVLNDIKQSGIQTIFTTHVNEVIKMASKVFDENESTILYFTRGGCKTYKFSEVSEFDKPLSWLGYL
ncbi:hypothetical protein HS7_13710 [Sulfolobales archaeon HS-7]|nr:hypothetical protein HS7_13710 [Sulfolobales archaeon HS-7]